LVLWLLVSSENSKRTASITPSDLGGITNFRNMDFLAMVQAESETMACCSIVANAVRFQLLAPTYHLGNFMRTPTPPELAAQWSDVFPVLFSIVCESFPEG